ncbi:MAG: Xaa-Pro peptidase family protein [Candidatus Methanomethylicia archaeon]
MNRLSKAIESLRMYELDALILLNQANIAYFLGSSLDYSAVIFYNDGEIHVVTHTLEYPRAKLLDNVNIYLYSAQSKNKEEVLARDIIEAIGKVIRGSVNRVGIEGYSIPYATYTRLSNILSNIEAVDATDAIWWFRLIKSIDEVEKIKNASKTVSKAISRAIEVIKPGVKEVDVAACIAYEIYSMNGFIDIQPIVASGPRSAIPHAKASNRVIRDKEVVVVDIVAKHSEYYSDMTRTVATRSITNELRKIYEVVREAQEKALETVTTGVLCSEVDRAARKIIEDYGYGKYFIHSTGHSIGLDVHESLRIAENINTELKEGMTITVEPGIYIENIGGVRIEDTILVTKNGAEVLTEYSKDFIEI